MYSSLESIDIATKGPDARYVQTDHRTRAEIEAEPEISVLFALIRILMAQQYGAAQKADARVVYTTSEAEPPAFLVEAVVAAGATLERGATREAQPLPDATATAEELADQAFAALAKRVCARVGLSDAAAALRAVEAETLVEPLDREQDQAAYWTRILELCALVGEILRGKGGGAWTQTDRAAIAFCFRSPDGSMVMPSAGAQRFLADGEGESMFNVLASFAERNAGEGGPLLPSLRARADAEREQLIIRPLLPNADGADLPVIAYGHDAPTTFGLLFELGDETLENLHERALLNLPAQKVEIEELDVKGLKGFAVTGSFFATEKLLEKAFMQRLQDRLGTPALVASVPRRGLMFVVAMPDPAATALLAALTESQAQTSRSISTALLIVTDGEVQGFVKIAAADAEPAPRQKKKGFFRRLFGG